MLSLLAALVAFVSYGDVRAVGAPIAWLAGSLLGIRRGHIEAALARAGLPDVAGAIYGSLATGIFELLWLAGGPKRALSRVTRFEPGAAETLQATFAKGRGAVFAASHTGNWELAAAAYAETRPLSVLVKRVSLGVFERFLWRLRERYGVGLLEGPGALHEARIRLERGEIVAVLIDQVPPLEANGTWLPFLGAPALTDRAAAALAASTGSPLVTTASRRDDDGHHVLHVLGVHWPPARDRRAWVLAVTAAATQELDAFVRTYPSQWLWLHRRWKRPAR